MSRLPYYKAYPRDFIEGTIGMPFEIKGGYRILLDLIYMQSGDLPDDARYISGLLGCSIRKWKSIRKFLINSDKIQVNGDFLTNERVVSELETLAKLQDKQRENRSGPNKNKGLATPKADHPEPEPEPRKKENYIKEFELFWNAFDHKSGRAGAVKSWGSIKGLDDALAVKIIDGAKVYADYRKNVLLPRNSAPKMAQGWLTDRRWEDEIKSAAHQTKPKLSESYSDWEDEIKEQGSSA